MDSSPKERMRAKLLEMRHNREKHKHRTTHKESTDKTGTCRRCGAIQKVNMSENSSNSVSEFIICSKCGNFNQTVYFPIEIEKSKLNN